MISSPSLFLPSFTDRWHFHLLRFPNQRTFHQILFMQLHFKAFLHRNTVHQHTLRRLGTDAPRLVHVYRPFSNVYVTHIRFDSCFSHVFLTFVSLSYRFVNSELFRGLHSQILFCFTFSPPLLSSVTLSLPPMVIFALSSPQFSCHAFFTSLLHYCASSIRVLLFHLT